MIQVIQEKYRTEVKTQTRKAILKQQATHTAAGAEFQAYQYQQK